LGIADILEKSQQTIGRERSMDGWKFVESLAPRNGQKQPAPLGGYNNILNGGGDNQLNMIVGAKRLSSGKRGVERHALLDNFLGGEGSLPLVVKSHSCRKKKHGTIRHRKPSTVGEKHLQNTDPNTGAQGRRGKIRIQGWDTGGEKKSASKGNPK